MNTAAVSWGVCVQPWQWSRCQVQHASVRLRALAADTHARASRQNMRKCTSARREACKRAVAAAAVPAGKHEPRPADGRASPGRLPATDTPQSHAFETYNDEAQQQSWYVADVASDDDMDEMDWGDVDSQDEDDEEDSWKSGNAASSSMQRQADSASRSTQAPRGRIGRQQAADDGPGSSAAGTQAAAAAAVRALQRQLGPSREEREAFDALWSEIGRELQLSKEATAMIGGQVARGNLPCNAQLLRTRTMALLALEGKGTLKPRQLLTQSNATLRHSPEAVAAAARRVTTLLPERDVNEMLVVMMPHITRVPTEILVAQLLELEYVWCPCFAGAAVPPRVFSLFLGMHAPGARPSHGEGSTSQAAAAGPGPGGRQHTARHASRTHAEDDSGNEESAPHGQSRRTSSGTHTPSSRSIGDDGTPVAGAQGDASTAEGDPVGETYDSADSGLAARTWTIPRLSLSQLLVRLRSLVDALGREAAYVGLARTPRPLLALEPGEVAPRVAALQALLRVSRAHAARLVEARGGLLAVPTATLAAGMSALGVALGWEAAEVGALVLLEPAALLGPAAVTGTRWARLNRAAAARPEWLDAVRKSPPYVLSRVLSSPDPDEALSRLEYLSQSNELPRITLDRIIRSTKGSFARFCPRYSLWRLQGGGLRRPQGHRGQGRGSRGGGLGGRGGRGRGRGGRGAEAGRGRGGRDGDGVREGAGNSQPEILLEE